MKANFIINPDDKFYPSADEWMWDYCTFLGKFTDSQGNNFDLGIYIRHDVPKDSILKYSNATVYNDVPGSYLSDSLQSNVKIEGWIGEERIKEVIRRAKILNLIK